MTRPLLLAFLFLITPAHAENKTDFPKQPACAAGVMVVQPEPDIRFVPVPSNVFYAQAQSRKLLKALKCAAPCESVGRVRSKVDCKCYLPGRLP